VAGAMAPVVAELTTLIERVTRLEHGAEVAAGVREAEPLAIAKPQRKRKTRRRAMSLSQWRREYMPEAHRYRLFEFLVNVGALKVDGKRVSGTGSTCNVYRVTELGARHGLVGNYRTALVAPGRERDLKRFIESMSL